MDAARFSIRAGGQPFNLPREGGRVADRLTAREWMPHPLCFEAVKKLLARWVFVARQRFCLFDPCCYCPWFFS
jgi:hypothetical protein